MYFYSYLLIQGFYCHFDSIEQHKYKNKFHVFNAYNNINKSIDDNIKLPAREFILKKSCKLNLTSNWLNIENLFVITLNGSIEYKLLREECDCHDLVDELLLNGIFPGNPVLPS